MQKALMILALTATVLCPAAYAAEDYTITLKGDTFSPAELTVPANQKIKLVVKNENNTAAEFESSELSREKVVGANSQITLMVGPLKPGSYHYDNDFHEESKGVITAK